jgi:hypothetical protein
MATITTINGGDAISDSRTDINTNFSNLNSDKIETSVLDTDTALTANSNAKIATQAAVKAFVEAGGNVSASETAKGIVEEATDAEVTAGTATGGTGAKLFVTPTKLATRLSSITSSGFTPLITTMSTIFETSGRFTAINNSGTSTFNTNGVNLDTTATGTRAAGITWALGVVSQTAPNVFLGSPVFTCSFLQSALGTTGSAYFGLGAVTKDGSGHTYTTDHCGFKILITGSVASLYATQGDGSTETASSALTTTSAANTDFYEVMLKMNGATSIDYYWRKNGGAWSSATNLTANIPNSASELIQFSVSNNATATNHVINLNSASYSR